MIWIDAAVIILYLIGMVFIALYTRNKAKTVKDYLLAGSKGLNGWMSAFAYGTTYFSAVIFIGYAGKFGFGFGLAAVWIGIGNAIIGSLLAWKVLARKTKNMTVRLDAKTMPDFFSKRYGSEKMKLVSAIIVFVFLIPYAASVYNGLGNLFSIVFGIPGWVVMLVLAGVTALYLFFGGYIATSLTDFVQAIIMFVGVTVMVFFFLASPKVNWGEGLKALSQNEMGLFIGGTSGARFLYDRPMSLVFLILLTSFGVWALPQTIHKYYTVRDKKAISQGTIVSTIFSLVIGFGAYFIGALSTRFYTNLDSVGGTTDNLIPYMVKDTLPNGLLGLIAVLVLAASMSTLASVSLASSSVVTIDIYKGSVNKNASDKRVTTMMRFLALVFVVISTVLAYLNAKFNLTAIAYMMGLSWGTLAGCFIGPYVLGVVWKKTTKTAAWTSIIGSLVLTATLIVIIGYDKLGWSGSLGKAIQQGIGSSPMIGVICMAYSMLSTFLVSLFTRPLPEERIREAFDKKIENEIA